MQCPTCKTKFEKTYQVNGHREVDDKTFCQVTTCYDLEDAVRTYTALIDSNQYTVVVLLVIDDDADGSEKLMEWIA